MEAPRQSCVHIQALPHPAVWTKAVLSILWVLIRHLSNWHNNLSLTGMLGGPDEMKQAKCLAHFLGA